MMQWWSSLQPRERLVLGGGAVVALLIVLWEFAWLPLTDGRAELRDSIESSQQLLGNLARTAASPSADVPSGNNSQSLFVLIDQTAQANGLGGALTRARPNGSNEINVTFSNASFDNLLTWLIALNESNGIIVDGASINSSRQEGLVSGQLLLRRG